MYVGNIFFSREVNRSLKKRLRRTKPCCSNQTHTLRRCMGGRSLVGSPRPLLALPRSPTDKSMSANVATRYFLRLSFCFIGRTCSSFA